MWLEHITDIPKIGGEFNGNKTYLKPPNSLDLLDVVGKYQRYSPISQHLSTIPRFDY